MFFDENKAAFNDLMKTAFRPLRNNVFRTIGNRMKIVCMDANIQLLIVSNCTNMLRTWSINFAKAG